MQADIHRQLIRLSVNYEEWDNGRTVLVRSFPAAKYEISRENTGFQPKGDWKNLRNRRIGATGGYAKPNLTPARASPPAMPIGVPSARQQAAPDIRPSSWN